MGHKRTWLEITRTTKSSGYTKPYMVWGKSYFVNSDLYLYRTARNHFLKNSWTASASLRRNARTAREGGMGGGMPAPPSLFWIVRRN